MDAFLSWFNLPAAAWLTALVLFLILEAATAGLVSLWFAGGALAALIASLCGAPLWLQIVLFLLVSAVLLAALRPFVRRFVAPRRVATNADRLIGAQALVTEEINTIAGTGAVRVSGQDWTARSADGAVLARGALVTVQRIEGAKLTVSPAGAGAEHAESPTP